MRTDPLELAREYGVAVEVDDLGAWGAATLVSEYDPQGPVIRINARALERLRARSGGLASCDLKVLLDAAVAHELFHHRERIGEVQRLPEPQRERAARAYARELVGEAYEALAKALGEAD